MKCQFQGPKRDSESGSGEETRAGGWTADGFWVKGRAERNPSKSRSNVPAHFLLQASAGTISRLALEARVRKVNEPAFSHQLSGRFYGQKN